MLTSEKVWDSVEKNQDEERIKSSTSGKELELTLKTTQQVDIVAETPSSSETSPLGAADALTPHGMGAWISPCSPPSCHDRHEGQVG